MISGTKLQRKNTMQQVYRRSRLIESMLYYKFFTFTFVMMEILLNTVLFYFLYLYRLSIEFNQELNIHTNIMTLPRIREYTLFYLIILGLFLFWSYRYRVYKFFLQTSLTEEIIKVIKGHSYTILIAVGIAFLLKINIYSRFVVIVYWLIAVIVSLLLRLIKRYISISLAKKGYLNRAVLIIGAGEVGQLICKEYMNNPGLGFKVTGFIDDRKAGNYINGIKVLGGTNEIDKIIVSHPVDDIIITIPSERNIVNEIIQKYRKYDVDIRIIPELYNLVTSTVKIENINSLPYMMLIKTPMRGLSLFIKRAFDLILSSLGLILILPTLVTLIILIKLDSPGPMIYKQKRVGKNGKLFNMYKFRSMVVDADQQLELLKKYNEVDGPAFKIKYDPRVTKIGRIMRKYSLDELPQLINVLKGDMSLVGPRPPLPREVDNYQDWEWRRLEVIPGITGLWQVSGRSDLSFNQWVNLDVYYIENWNLTLDLKILLKTIPVVLGGKGAY